MDRVLFYYNKKNKDKTSRDFFSLLDSFSSPLRIFSEMFWKLQTQKFLFFFFLKLTNL